MSKLSQSTGKQARDGKRGATGRDFDALRQRRMRAAAMFDRGRRQADVASALGVSAQTVSKWYRAWSVGGREALAGAGRAGRMRKLSVLSLPRSRRS
ncbi:helix-turn-helix domain-containing protein [Saccharopolyspora pogona]|uniref:helix-turn-helix domain-containing protein n=1 Tax=Saccharopolyspora pogona TaxID=333966 RepID=UPI001683104E|nr:helix-turn-helix domain-containing protein [Saccharopolyspora pogona]